MATNIFSTFDERLLAAKQGQDASHWRFDAHIQPRHFWPPQGQKTSRPGQTTASPS